tara:strand:+ start:299 stop:694 length:396 start_codon:yes stop_codon:yes gene_type:complete
MGKINLNRTVFDKRKFEQTVDTSFSQLVPKEEQKFFDVELATINDFFTIYTNLFYEIPKDGETNSHTFLIKESSEYVDFDAINDEIQALLEEITSLRQEMIQKDRDNLDLTQKLAQAQANVTSLQAALSQS